MYNHSINNTVFPNKWKEAKVTPLHKKGPHEELNNCRPILILPILTKGLEKHVHDSLSDFLHEFKLSQHNLVFEPNILVKQILLI